MENKTVTQKETAMEKNITMEKEITVKKATQPRVLEEKSEPIHPKGFRFVYMKRLTWLTPDGNESPYEVAERTGHGRSEVDAVSVMPIIRSATNAFEPSTVIVEQFRPPMNAMVLEFPAGLVDANETPRQAAIRELYEETGYFVLNGKAIELEDKKDFPELDAEALEKDETIKITPLLGADPGMTTANLKLVTVDVTLPGELVTYETRLDKGEYLNRRIVTIEDLPKLVKDYTAKGFTIDAKLAFWVHGYEMAKQL